MALQVTPELAISTLLTVGAIGLSYGSLKTKLNGAVADITAIKKKIWNGDFVRRSECDRCQSDELEDTAED